MVGFRNPYAAIWLVGAVFDFRGVGIAVCLSAPPGRFRCVGLVPAPGVPGYHHWSHWDRRGGGRLARFMSDTVVSPDVFRGGAEIARGVCVPPSNRAFLKNTVAI